MLLGLGVIVSILLGIANLLRPRGVVIQRAPGDWPDESVHLPVKYNPLAVNGWTPVRTPEQEIEMLKLTEKVFAETLEKIHASSRRI